MARAVSLLDNDYSFFEERDIYTAQEAFRAAQSKAQHATQLLKAGIQQDVSTYRTQLNSLIEPYPLLQEAVVQDMKMVTQHAQHFSQQFLAQIHRYTSQHIPSLPESLFDDSFDFSEAASTVVKRPSSFETFKSNLQTLRLVGNIQALGKTGLTVSNLVTGFLGFLFVQLVIDRFTTGILVGAAVASFFLTPVLEELVKVFSVRYIKSQTSLYVTYAAEALYESFLLVITSVGIAQRGFKAGGSWSILGPIGGALFLMSSLFGENYIFQRQGITAQMYRDDITRLGKIHPRTIFKGIVLHLTWDVVGFLSGLQRTLKLFLNTLFDVGLVIRNTPGLSTAFTRLFGPLRK